MVSIAITTASDKGYLPAACCQLKSTYDHLADPGAARLHLVLCDVTETDVAEARRFFDRREMAVDIVVPEDVIRSIRPVTKRWPRAAYLRLYFDRIFGAEYDRLVYFDADTRVRAPLGPLLTAPLRGAPVGAVHDFIYYLTGNIRRRRRELHLAADAPYLQSGVMVFDWPATLRDGGLQRARDYLDQHPDRCQEAPDQDALNASFEGLWTPLDPRWNLHELYLMFGGAQKPYIEHYTSTKPWSPRRPAAWADAAEWYKRELADTAWRGFIAPQSAADLIRARLVFLKFRYGPRLRDTIAAHAPLILDLLGKPRIRSEEKELPWAPRSRRDVEMITDALICEALGLSPRLYPPEAVVSRG